MQVQLQVSRKHPSLFSTMWRTMVMKMWSLHYHFFSQGNASMPSGHIPVYCLCILPHNAHQFPGVLSSPFNIIDEQDYTCCISCDWQYSRVCVNPQHSPTLHPQTPWQDPPCPSCSRSSIWPIFCIFLFKFVSINHPPTTRYTVISKA